MEDDSTGAPTERRPLTLGEVAGLVAIAGVGVLATVSLALAQTGHHDGWLAIAITVGVLLLAAAAAWRWSRWPGVRVDRLEVGLIAATLVVTGALFLPGATYAYVDKDPGVYAAHAFAIAREGDVQISDPVLAAGLTPDGYSGGRFPGVWKDTPGADTVTSQFYHLYSALLATGHDVAGKVGVFQATPLLAMLSVVLLLLGARRAAGTSTAVVAAAILGTCMLQVWQAKSPGSEILAQLVLVGSLFAAVVAIDAKWWPAAAVSGALLPIGFLVRPDGVLYLLLGVAAAAALLASGRHDARVGAFLGGMLLLTPYAFWNAYVERSSYTLSNDVPGATTVAAVGVGLLACGGAIAFLRRRSAPVTVSRRVQLVVGGAGSVAAVAVLLLLWYRERLFGADFAVHPATGVRFATYDEDALHWLAWFLSVPGIVALAAGIVVLLVTRWKPALMALIVPGALLLPLYLWDPRIASRLMWWGRRFVPALLPAIVLLIGVAVAWLLHRRQKLPVRVGGLALALYLVGFGAQQSWELRHHDEMGGSWTMGTAVAGNGSEDGSLFLFTRPTSVDVIQPNRNLPAALAWIHGRAASILENPPTMEEIDEYAAALPDREVLLVVPGDELPDGLPAERFELRDTIDQPIVFWEESHTERPDEARGLRYALSVWALRPS